ncbi:MAG: hypothetical protein AMXMBFR84_02890 [Candidatus Hydrogenedentota bacterium]
MTIAVQARNESGHRGCYRQDVLARIAERVCRGERARGPLEVSVLFCDDAFIADLNRRFRRKRGPTDVLSFGQPDDKMGGDLPPDARTLGDIVISLDTVVRRCNGDPARARAEVRLLFCHGLLHLLGYDHGSAAERESMTEKQAAYLEIPMEEAWIAEGHAHARANSARHGR